MDTVSYATRPTIVSVPEQQASPGSHGRYRSIRRRIPGPARRQIVGSPPIASAGSAGAPMSQNPSEPAYPRWRHAGVAPPGAGKRGANRPERLGGRDRACARSNSSLLQWCLSPGHGRAPRQAQGRHGRRETPRPPTSKAATLAPFANTPKVVGRARRQGGLIMNDFFWGETGLYPTKSCPPDIEKPYRRLAATWLPNKRPGPAIHRGRPGRISDQ